MSDSIKVAIKVRPLIKREKDESLAIQWAVQGNTIVATDAEMRKRSDGGFQFDHIFDMSVTNNDVFHSIVRPIVDAAVNGFNGTVFAYGQTSSGKTYTMMGTPVEPGIIPLAIEHMFDAIADTPGREFLLRVSYLEIYNETVNDLLSKEGTDLKVHEDLNGQVFVKCKEEVTNCPENVLSIMLKGDKKRRIGETNMNERSSRSHTIFRITIESRETNADSDDAIQVSQLNMVDLAGSERIRQTGATGERLREGRHINLSLSTLALVIKQLSETQDQQKYINFRDSKLTRLLQTSLGGNAMTAIICAVTPAALEETQCTLSFASRARSIKNKPELNEVMSDGVLLKRYSKQIEKLHAELERMKKFNRSAEVEEMESKMQEKDRINECLEERIRLLQTRIVPGDNRNSTESFKCKAKRRRTWCGTGGYKLNTSAFHSRVELSPIKEMSPLKSKRNNINPTNIMDSSFQIAYTDFELELMNSETERNEEEIDNNEDTFITYRKENQVRFKDNIIIHKSCTSHENSNVSPEKTNMHTQTVSQSPGTPKELLRERISYWTKEYSQLQEYTTLEKQIYLEDQQRVHEEKFSMLEKKLENVTSDKNDFEHIASELRKKLTTAESRNVSMEDQLKAQMIELQRIPDLERKLEQLSAQETQNISGLQNQITLLIAEREDQIAKQNEEPLIRFSTGNENNKLIELEACETGNKSEKDKLQDEMSYLQNKLMEAESCNNSLKNKLNDQRIASDQNRRNLEEQIVNLTSEKNAFERTVCEMQSKLREAEGINAIKNKLNEQMDVHTIIEEQEECVKNRILEGNELKDTIHELQEKSETAELHSDLINDDINKQELKLKKTDLENEIDDLTFKKNGLEFKVQELQENLAKIENDISIQNKSDGQQLYLQKIQELEAQIARLISEKDENKRISMEPYTQSSPLKKESASSHDEDKDESNHLRNRIIDLQNIQDIQGENMPLKEQASGKSTMLDYEYNLSNGDSSKIIEDLSRTFVEEDSAKLSADLILKTQKFNEIKHDVQSFKGDIENLQKTICLLTTENTELANKLSIEKIHNEESTIRLQKTIDELHAQNSKVMDDKLELENNLAMLKEQMEMDLRTNLLEDNLKEEQIIKYEKQINELTPKNTELLSDIVDKTKVLMTLEESKSSYEHDCMYKDKLTELMKKNDYLMTENSELSDDLDKIEENDSLRKECDILKSKLELSLENKENVDNNDTEQLRTDNTLLKAELIGLKYDVKVLTEEILKISNQLIDTIEDNARKNDTCNNSLHSSVLWNNTLTTNDAMNKSITDGNLESGILNLREIINHLTHLNRKLSDLKLSKCIQCTHLKELNKDLKLKLEVKSQTLAELQRKFDHDNAKRNALIMKANEGSNISLCNSTFNSSFSESMNVTFVEETLQSINNELQSLKEDRDKSPDSHKEKYNEIVELQDNNVTDSTSTDDVISSVKKSPNKISLETKLDNIKKDISNLRKEIQKIKDNLSVRADLNKFTNDRESLLGEINTLKVDNADLLQKLSENELSRTTMLEKTSILENKLIDTTKKLQECTTRCKEIENAKLLLETEAESLREDNTMKERTVGELRQSVSCLEYKLDLMKKQKEEVNDTNIFSEQEYEKKLTLRATNEELTKNKITITQEFTDYTKESESKLLELNEKTDKYISENNYLKQEMIRLHDVEDKFEKLKNEYQSKVQENIILAEDNKKLKEMLNNVSKGIIKEIKSLKPEIDVQEFMDKSVEELFQIFLPTILAKEKEIMRTMQKNFNKEKQKLEDEKQQSMDAEKRITLWSKKLESEIEKYQRDLSEQENKIDGLQKEVMRLQQLLEEKDYDRDLLREENNLLKTDLGNLQVDLDRYTKIDTVNEEAIVIAQKREKQAQEAIKNKKVEFQMKLKSEKEANNKQVEDLMCTIESFRTKNMELMSNIEGFEANQKQLENIINLKTNELMRSNQMNQTTKTEYKQLTEAYNDLNLELEEKKKLVAEITELLKIKCDKLTEYEANLETIISENKFQKQQINERKANIEKYKTEIETLRMANKNEIDAIQDKLNLEQLKNIELNKQITELNSKNATLLEEINTLKNDYETLQCKCITLEKRVRNSTSKILIEGQIEELKDLNTSLRNNLDGASNRITELQATKTDLMKQLISLNGQYDTACRENEQLKESLSSYKSKYKNVNVIDEKCDALLREKNQIALELEATKVKLNQQNKEMETCANKIKDLTEKNTELDQEAEDLAEVIRQHDGENAKLQDQFYSCRAEIETLQDKIKVLEKEDQSLLPQSDKTEKFHNDECNCVILKNKIREMQLEVMSKNGKIATLELQVKSGSFPYQTECKKLQENLLAYNDKNNELKAEVKRLQLAMLRTAPKECDACKQRLINKKDQVCQTINMPNNVPNNVLRFCSISSGIIEDEIKITKLEKEKKIMKDLCRSRSKTIKDLQKQLEEYSMRCSCVPKTCENIF